MEAAIGVDEVLTTEEKFNYLRKRELLNESLIESLMHLAVETSPNARATAMEHLWGDYVESINTLVDMYGQHGTVDWEKR